MMNQIGSNSGMTALGMVPFTPAPVLQAEEQAAAAAKSEAASRQQAMMVSSLATYIDSCWSDAKEAKVTVETQMLKNMRQRAGEYEQNQLQAIGAMGGSSVYVLLTATKCRAAISWLNDLLRPVGDRPWGIRPTPVAELPGDRREQIAAEAEAVGAEAIAAVMQVADQIDPAILTAEIAEFLGRRQDEMLKEIQEEAEVGAERMTLLMDDQLQQGGWNNSFWQVVDDIATMPAGIIKGPVIRKEKTQQWVQGPDGKWVVSTEPDYVPKFYRVSPFDLYPSPDSRHPDDGYLIERHKLTRSELQSMIGVPGYSEEAIRKVLDEYGTGYITTLSIDSERAPLEFSGNTNPYKQKGEKIEALEFWGSVQGKMLIDWGMKDNVDPLLEYEVNAWKIGNHVIRAIINPDKLGRKPYSVDSWERIPGSFWGRGVPELMGDIQDVCNSLARSIVNNGSIASGPQVEINTDRCDNSEGVHPWKIWEVTNTQMSDAPAVRFTTPPCIVEPLLRVFDHFSAQAEDQTGIPRWAYGRSNPGDASSTSSGLSMLMTSASRGIKEVVSHLDTMISACIERLYDYNMNYSEDESVKRDCRIIARGSTSILQREQRLQQLNQVLAQTNNPTDMQIIGLDGRAKLLTESIKAMDMDIEGIVPTKDELKELVAKVEQQQAALLAAGQNPGQAKGVAPNAAPDMLDPAGNKAGGESASLFQNLPADMGGAPPNGVPAQP